MARDRPCRRFLVPNAIQIELYRAGDPTFNTEAAYSCKYVARIDRRVEPGSLTAAPLVLRIHVAVEDQTVADVDVLDAVKASSSGDEHHPLGFSERKFAKLLLKPIDDQIAPHVHLTGLGRSDKRKRPPWAAGTSRIVNSPSILASADY